MKVIKYLLLVIVCILAGSFYFFSTKSKSKKDGTTLVVGTAAGYAPWVSINAQGDYEGFDIDVINAVANTMNKKLVLQDLGSMSALLMALDQNKIDAIIWGMSITQDRLERMAMVRYQGDTVKSFPLLFWGKIPNNIITINDMKNMTVCVEPSSSQDTVLSNYPFINTMPVEKIDDALLNIQYGKADAAFVEPAIAKKFKNKYPEIQSLDVPLAPENQEFGVGICIRPADKELIKGVQNAVDALLQNNVIQEFEAKWDITS